MSALPPPFTLPPLRHLTNSRHSATSTNKRAVGGQQGGTAKATLPPFNFIRSITGLSLHFSIPFFALQIIDTISQCLRKPRDRRRRREPRRMGHELWPVIPPATVDFAGKWTWTPIEAYFRSIMIHLPPRLQ
ncbi:hypothetical protein E4U21_002803 [Claviceps maximensis]|nr:hypothetical protein E4U21_002803 [Claviceps maximensis]